MVWQLNYFDSVFEAPKYNSENYENDKQIFEKFISIQQLKEQELGVIFASNYNFLPSPKQQTELNNLFVKITLDNLHIIAARKAFDTAETIMGMEFIWDNGWLNPRSYQTFFYSDVPTVLRYNPLSKEIGHLIQKMYIDQMTFRTFFSPHLFHFTALLPFVIICIVLLCGRWYPSSALYALCLFMQFLMLILVLAENNLRYVYFLILGGYLLPLLVFSERISLSNNAKK